jgi:hypothetical protein
MRVLAESQTRRQDHEREVAIGVNDVLDLAWDRSEEIWNLLDASRRQETDDGIIGRAESARSVEHQIQKSCETA